MSEPMRHPLSAADLDAIERAARAGQAVRAATVLRLLADYRHQRALNDRLLGYRGMWTGGETGTLLATAGGEGGR